MPDVEIAWNEGTMAEWAAAFARVPRPTLPQCFGYAQAMGKTYGHVPRLGTIAHAGRPIGLVTEANCVGVDRFTRGDVIAAIVDWSLIDLNGQRRKVLLPVADGLTALRKR